jgi:hypothetical protein
MKTLFAWGLASACLFTTPAGAGQYEQISQLMREAIDAPDGMAKGVIVGPVARKFSQATGSHAPVRVEVSTLQSFGQEGCRRLNVRLTQADVPTTAGKRVEFDAAFQLNLCRDGNPPTEGVGAAE